MDPKIRKYLVLAHLIFAGLLAPAFLLVAVSGGLYLLGNKGVVKTSALTLPPAVALDFKSKTLESDVRALLKKANIDHKFEYIKLRENLIQLRPTSRSYLQFEQSPEGLKAFRKVPNFQGSMIELHKGHGPKLFKFYQKLVALGLIGVVFGGLLIGVLSKAYRRKTVISITGGLILFLGLAFWV